MPRGTTEAGGYRRWIAATATALVTVSVAGYAAVAATATATVIAARPGALLADHDAESHVGLRRLHQVQINTALASRPLDQRLANVAMARVADRQGEGRITPWIAAVSRLGWRDTPALQNMMYVAATRNDIPAVFNIGDALLRRRQLTDQMIPVLSMLESDPASRDILVERLASRVSWRGLYLSSTVHLRTPAQLRARYALLRALQRRGSPIASSEATPTSRAFEQANLHDLGFALWRAVRPGLTRPLDDTRFAAASESFRLGKEDPVAYQWQIPNGEGFRADAVTEDGRTMLDIDWNGRGVPVFAQQRSSASPGRYALDIRVPSANVVDLAAFDFRMVCDTATVSFRQDAQRPQRFVTEATVPCAYPMFQIAGNIQSAATPRHLSIRSLALRALPGTREPG